MIEMIRETEDMQARQHGQQHQLPNKNKKMILINVK